MVTPTEKLPRRSRRPTKSIYTRDTEHSSKSLNNRRKPEQLRKRVGRVGVNLLVTANKFPLNLLSKSSASFLLTIPNLASTSSTN